jgi:hypothetical protein
MANSQPAASPAGSLASSSISSLFNQLFTLSLELINRPSREGESIITKTSHSTAFQPSLQAQRQPPSRRTPSPKQSDSLLRAVVQSTASSEPSSSRQPPPSRRKAKRSTRTYKTSQATSVVKPRVQQEHTSLKQSDSLLRAVAQSTASSEPS